MKDSARPASRAQVRRALRFLEPYRGSVAAILALTLGIAAASAAEPLVLKYVFDGLEARRGWAPLAAGLAGLLALSLAVEALGAVSNYLTWRLRLGVQHRLQHETAAKLYALPLGFHHVESVGGIVSRVERGINGVLDALSALAFNILPSLAYLAFSILVMARIEWRLLVLVLAFTAIPALIGGWAAKRQTRRERHLTRRWSRIFSRLYETLTGIVTVKCFAAEEAEHARFTRDVAGANRVVIRGVGFDTGVGAAKNLVAVVARMCAIGLGAALVLRGEITIGTLVAFLGYAGGIFNPVQGLTGVYETLRRASVSLDTLFSILDMPDPMADRPGARRAPRLRGEVRFEDVHYAYEPQRPVLRGLDLHVRAGEKIAIVGPSGAGKSTTMWLLLRFYDPTRGVIRLDGMDLRELTQRSVRDQVGVVTQETLLWRASVRDNIAYGRPGASAAEVEAAARAASADEFIRRLPRGYDTRLGERGATLSAGERQRIAIARAILRDPPILVLDEATSNLDPESEAMVRRALREVARGRTTFVIAHRITMAMEADRIVVLRHGRVIEVGSHGELATSGGYYASMIRSHAAGVRLGGAA